MSMDLPVIPQEEAAKTVADCADATKTTPENQEVGACIDEPQTDKGATAVDEQSKPKLIDMSAAELVDALAVLLQQEQIPRRSEVEAYKTAFYRRKQTADEQPDLDESIEDKAHMEAQEERLKDLLAGFREINQRRLEQMEQERKENLEKKKLLLGKLEQLLASTEEFGKISPTFHDIRDQWKQVGNIPESNVNDIQKEYSRLIEQFYDLKQINDEFREYDFRKNLEAKTILIEEAERLAEQPDAIQAFRRLQDLHNQWRDLGPVARDLREALWTRFKAASTTINKRHQDHFDKLRGNEQENMLRKTALCEEAESINLDEIKTSAQWNKATQKVLDLQAGWKQIGFAPRKDNDKLYKRFRAACDAYFVAKSAFYSRMRQEFDVNLQRKREMAEEAELLQESSDWRTTGARLEELQKEWKTVGPVPHKYNETIWKRFRAACDVFFERRKKEYAEVYAEERENLKRKKAVIGQINSLLEDSNDDDMRSKLDKLSEEFRSIGYVAYREKENIYQAYRKAMDAVYERFDLRRSKRRMDDFRSSIRDIDPSTGKGKLLSDRSRMMHTLERMRQELQTYTNNLGFFSVSSKGGNSLVQEMERKQQKLQDDIRHMEEKINLLDRKIDGKELPAVEEDVVTPSDSVEDQGSVDTTQEETVVVEIEEAEPSQEDAVDLAPQAEDATREEIEKTED